MKLAGLRLLRSRSSLILWKPGRVPGGVSSNFQQPLISVMRSWFAGVPESNMCAATVLCCCRLRLLSVHVLSCVG
jgi:hypothetical protein